MVRRTATRWEDYTRQGCTCQACVAFARAQSAHSQDECTCGGPPEKVLSRYYGRVEIDPQRVNKDMGLIVEEVIERLTSQIGCEVEITLEINANWSEGFDESTIRTISENSRTLKFEHYGFEEG